VTFQNLVGALAYTHFYEFWEVDSKKKIKVAREKFPDSGDASLDFINRRLWTLPNSIALRLHLPAPLPVKAECEANRPAIGG
jgi:hypothetical protein